MHFARLAETRLNLVEIDRRQSLLLSRFATARAVLNVVLERSLGEAVREERIHLLRQESDLVAPEPMRRSSAPLP